MLKKQKSNNFLWNTVRNIGYVLSVLVISLVIRNFAVSSVFAVGSGPVDPFVFNAVPGIKPGTVKVSWFHDESIHTYNLFYGISPDNLTYGVVDLIHKPLTNEFIIEGLIPNKNYYFKLTGTNIGIYAESGPILARAASENESDKPVYYSQSKNYEMPYLFSINQGKTSGSVDVMWFDNKTADRYDIVYGTKPNEYTYGSLNMPNIENVSNTFTVRSLSPGKTYYFSLVAKNDDTFVLWTRPVSITVR